MLDQLEYSQSIMAHYNELKEMEFRIFWFFFGSARIQSKEQAQTSLDSASKDISPSELDDLKSNLKMSQYTRMLGNYHTK